MAFVTFSTTTPTNPAVRTDDGAKGRVFPWTGATEVRDVLPSCQTCTLTTAHGEPCSRVGVERTAGDRLETDAAAGTYASAAMMVETDSALFAASFVAGVYPQGNYLFNLGSGTANNVLQREQFEFLGAGTVGQWRARGRDIRRLTFGISRVNPEWPLPDPITGTTARIQWDNAAIALPVGGILEPEPPSVLAGKLTPMITKLYPPTGAFQDGDEVEFEFDCWADLTNLSQPYNAKLPPADGRYFFSVGYMGITPERYGNWQAYPQAVFTRHSVEVTAAALALVDGALVLKNTAGENCRVLPRWAGSNVLCIVYTLTGVGAVTMPAEDVDEAMGTVDTGTGWITTLNLTGLLTLPGLASVKVWYMPQARTADGAGWIVQGACSNSQEDHSGSYKHGTGRRCNNVECSKFVANGFRDECWDPKATGFHLRPGLGPGTDVQPATDPRDNSQLAQIAWAACGTVIAQGLPGVSSYTNFWFERRERSGIQTWTGGFCDRVPVSPGDAYIEIMGNRTFGQRVAYTDDGDRHRLAFGLHDCEESTLDGAIYTMIPEWDARLGQLRESITTPQESFPSFGPSGMSIVDGRATGGAMANRLRRSAQDHELFVVGINPARVVSAVVDYAARIS